jgi:hypothetical protein
VNKINAGSLKVSSTPGRRGRLQLARRGSLARWGRQIELELLHQELLVSVQLCVTAQGQRTAVGCPEVDIEHLAASLSSTALGVRPRNGFCE